MSEPKKNLFGMSTRNQYIVMTVLMVAFLGLMAHRLSGGSPTTDSAGAAVQPQTPSPEPFSIDQLISVPKVEAPRIAVPPESLSRNPFSMPPQIRGVIEAKESAEEQTAKNTHDPEIESQGRALKLKGVIGGEKERVAFIDDRAVRQGDTIKGFIVVEIDERSVLIKKNATEVLLELDSRVLSSGF